MMQLLMTRKKWLFIGVIVISVGIIFIMQSTITNSSNHKRNFRHLKLLARPDTQRILNVDSYFSKNSNENKGQSSDFIDIDNQDFPVNLIPGLTSLPTDDLKYSSNVHELADALGYKLSTLTTQERKLRPVCHNPNVVANSCDDGRCLRTSFSTGLKERVAELISPSHLQISNEIQAILDNMVKNVPKGKEFTIVTAVSSNHFLEVQGLIKNTHLNIYPNFKNFTFIVFNIGLTSSERAQMVKHCKCHVVDFPFDEFPGFVQKIRCYSWKPIILNALFNHAKTVMWVDTSVRFEKDPSQLSYVFKRVEKRTIQLGSTQVISPFRTYRSMYHFFGDEPCMYLEMFQALAGVFAFKSEYFVKRAVLDPWVACAISENCMCPSKQPKKSCVESKNMLKQWEDKKGPIIYGLCHRFDQSSISLILQKLYQGFFHWVTFHIGSYLQIKRNDNQAYFHSLEENS